MCVAASISTASADTPVAPSPAMSPKPKHVSIAKNLSVSGIVRAYSFDRESQVGSTATKKFLPNPPNQSATNFLAGIHSDYTFGKSGFSLGASYYGAYPFGTNGHNPQFNGLADNTLPASTLSSFPETYLKYKSARFTATAGNQFLNEKWESGSDVRLKPASYQGISAAYNITKHLTVGATRVIRFESRTASAYGRYTLLTAPVLGGPKLPEIDTSGSLLANLKYATPYVSALVENYSFYDIANLQYAEARGNLSLKGAMPYVALQYVGENQAGKAVVGQIHNHTYGIQIGANVTRNLLANVSYDGSPTDLATSAAGRFGSSKLSGSPLFAYGAIASPYSQNYGTDPLFTTSLVGASNVETRSTRSFKAGMFYTSDNKRLQFYATRTYFENIGYVSNDTRYETDGDITYYLSPVGKGAYKGLSIRQRYGVFTAPSEASKSFQQARTQLQYSF